MEEENFPRGGVKSKRDASEQKTGTKRKQVEDSQPGESKNKKSKRRRGKHTKDEKETPKQKKHKIQGEVSGQVAQLYPQYLTKKYLYSGMLLLGYVKQIKNYNLVIALPNGLSGTVPITNISQAYTESLQKYSEAEDQNAEGVSTLSELFKVGMLVACKLTEYDHSQDNKTLTLSIDPRDVNSEISTATLRHGMCMYGNVTSQEDHGYIVDIGIKGVQAFLKNKHAERYITLHNDGAALCVGQCVLCKINMKGDRMSMLAGQNRVINITIDPVELKQIEMSEALDLSFSSLLPGMKVNAKVERVVKDDGIVVQFHKFRGTIHKSHLPRLPQTYTQGEQVICSILYIHPLVKTVTLTQLPHLTSYVGVATEVFGGYKVGDTVNNATVKKTDRKRGVFLNLKDGVTGFAGLNNLSDEPVENLQETFKKGSTQRCRVLGFYPMEGLVIVTMKMSILDEKFMRASDIQPGDIIECTMKKLDTKGMLVHVQKKITGIIPMIHLADVTLKHPEQKFKEGQKLKCRVIHVDKKRSKLTLTHKKALVNSKYPVISSYDQVEVGQILEGYIDIIKEFGCFVRFYNTVQGLVPRQFLSTEDIQYPEKVFYVGQVVRCKVLSVDPPNKRLKLSFVLEGKLEFGKTVKEIPADFKLGKCVSCKVLKKIKTGLDVELSPSGVKAFLPKMHLSDSLEICEALWAMHRPGDVIDKIMYWNMAKLPVMTCKPCLIEAAAEEEEFVTSFDALQPGMMLAGAVRSIQPYGIFLEFVGRLFGLVPRQYAADKRVEDLGLLYQLGHTVVAKVMDIDKDKQRFLASLRMEDCYHGNTKIGLDLTWKYLEERGKVLDSMKKSKGIKGTLAELQLGSIQKVIVKKVTELGAICELQSGIKAVVTNEHISGTLNEGDRVNGVLLHVDITQICVEVSLLHNLNKWIKAKSKDKVAKLVSVNEIHKASVVLIKEDFVLVSFSTGPARGLFAYLPAKRHWNDVLERHQYVVGQENKVMIKKIEGDVILVSLKIHEDRLEEDDKQFNVSDHTFKLGDVSQAVVRHIYKDCMHVTLGSTNGRIHVTEMLDDVENGTCPTMRFRKKQQISVRVIGFRDSRSNSYLPISHPKLKKALPECSMKPSTFSLQQIPGDYMCGKNKFQIGDKVITSVDKFLNQYLWTSVNPRVKGKVHIFNISDDIKKLNAPFEHFTQGACYNATVIKVLNNELVELSFTDHALEVEPGKPTVGIVTNIKRDSGLDLQLPEGIVGTVDITDMSDDYTENPTQGYRVGDIVSGTVISLERLSRQAEVSFRPAVKPNHTPVDPRISSISDIKLNKNIRGFVIKASRKGIFVRLGAGINGHVPPDCIVRGKRVVKMARQFQKGGLVTVKTLGFGENKKEMELSVLEEDTGVKVRVNPNCLVNNPEAIETIKERKRSLSHSSVDSESGKTKKIKLKNMETSDLDESIQLEINDLEEMDQDRDEEEDMASSAAEEDGHSSDNESDSDKLSVEIDEETVDKDWETLKRVSVTDEADESMKSPSSEKKKRKKTVELASDSESDSKFIKDSDSKSVDKSKRKKGKGDNGNVSSDENLDSPGKKKKAKKDSKDSGKKAESAIPVEIVSAPSTEDGKKPVLEISESFSWDAEFNLPTVTSGDISSDDSDDDAETKKPVKKTKEQLRQERLEEEKRLYQSEMQRLEGDVQPQTADDFDRLVLQSPDSSIVWLRYMAFHLETTEIDKARAVAERALKTISFREEQEKMNVWVAYLNLENLYCSPESVRKVLLRAVQQCDEVKIYYQMISIYVKSGKIEEAEQLFNTLVKKYSANKEVWIKFAEFYFQNGRVESARKLLQRCLKSLETKFHVDTITKFAQYEFKHGEPERGKTMFENTLSTYPKRTDLWSVYIDMVTKLGELDNTRSLYNRVLTHKMSMKKMKFFFKKYLEFEERFGTADQVAEVKKKALQYVESHGFVDE